jgi:4'-phosphopantetheinyl transferase
MTDETSVLERGNPEICFGPPPQNIRFDDGEAHIFCAALDQPRSRMGNLDGFLAEDERARASKFVYARDRNRFVAGRGMLREMLGCLLHVDPSQLVFVYGRHGKPQLSAPMGGRYLYFNVAHCDAFVVYIVSAQSAVGIDLERIRPVREAESIMAQTFSKREYAEWCSLPESSRAEVFFKSWTRKEALVKVVGGNLGMPLNQLLAQPPEAGVSARTVFTHFFLHHFIPVRGYQGAAAIENAQTPKYWSWPPG